MIVHTVLLSTNLLYAHIVVKGSLGMIIWIVTYESTRGKNRISVRNVIIVAPIKVTLNFILAHTQVKNLTLVMCAINHLLSHVRSESTKERTQRRDLMLVLYVVRRLLTQAINVVTINVVIPNDAQQQLN